MKASSHDRDAVALCGVPIDELETSASYAVLRRRLTEGAIRLVDRVTLSVHGFDAAESLRSADAELQTLRTHLRLAHDMSIVDEELYVDCVEQAGDIGRQIGGWRKKLARGEGRQDLGTSTPGE